MNPKTKKRLFYLVLVAITVASMAVLGELTIRVFRPTEYLHPRYDFSKKYGFILYENAEMVHGYPGRYKFRYTTNEYGCRGRAVPLTSSRDKPAIVVLGDSYAFGMGVNDGEEFPSRMYDRLQNSYDVINLGNPGWSLTQEIRRFFDFGSLYQPEIVILQFCSNDPKGNFANRVTQVRDGEIKFFDTGGTINEVKKYLSSSIIQRSQLYNFVRSRIHALVVKRTLASNKKQQARITESTVPIAEQYYGDLLEAFATRLSSEGVALIVISVNNQIESFPYIMATVNRLEREGKLNYVDVVPWFDKLPDYKSKEGHWGTAAHQLIADGLVEVITAAD